MKENESSYRLFFENTADGMLLAGPDGVVLDANPQACRILDRTREDLVAAGLDGIFDASDHRLGILREEQRIAGTARGGLLLLRGDGTSLPVEITIASRRNEDEVCVLFRRSLNSEQAQKELRESAAQYRAMVENAPDLMMICNFDNTFRYVNPAVERVLGYEPEEIIGTFIPEIMHPDDLEDAARAYMEVTNNPLTSPIRPYRYRHKDGSWRYIEGIANNLVDDSDVRGVVITTRDVTERVRAEQELRQSEERLAHLNEELARSNRELEQFAYVVSHGLRSPLRSMTGFGQILLEDYAQRLDEQGRDFLQRLLSSGRHIEQLVEDILNLSRVTYRPLRREPVDLSALAASVAAQLKEAEPEREVELVIEEGLWDEGDPGLLRVALENLLANAWKYTAKKERAKVEFGATEEQEEGSRAYFVRDDGAGFDMAHAGQLFEPFRRLHRASEFEGTGIGLATVERIVSRHGGKVWAEGEVGGGATFYFTMGPDGEPDDPPAWGDVG